MIYLNKILRRKILKACMEVILRRCSLWQVSTDGAGGWANISLKMFPYWYKAREKRTPAREK